MGRSGASKAGERWIVGPKQDLSWIVLCPLLCWGGLALLWAYGGMSERGLYALLFAFVVTGHHMPGWLRAFGEPVVYQRYKARLWCSLLAVPALVILPTAYGFGAIALCVAAVFDLWHVAMQQHGFGRIYGAKAGDRQRLSARLDLLCVLTWYGSAVVWSDAWMGGNAAAMRAAGFLPFASLAPESWQALRQGALVVSALLLVVYVGHAVFAWRRDGATPWLKHLLHLVGFSVIAVSYQESSWYRAQSVQNVFHATQYFFMVWAFSHLAIRRDPSPPRSFYRRLFQRRRGVAPYLVLIGLYGLGAYALASSSYRIDGGGADRTEQVLGSIGLTSLLLHFYADSFIWKVRDASVRTALAIGTGVGEVKRAALPSEPAWKGAAHAVAYFGLPMLLVVGLGASRETFNKEERYLCFQNEALLFPESVEVLHNLGMAALELRELPVAQDALERAVAMAPSYEGPADALFQLAEQRGDSERLIRYGRLHLKARPGDSERHYKVAVALAKAKRLPEAEHHYKQVIALRPESAPAYENLGVVYKWQGRTAEAVEMFRKAVSLEPSLGNAVLNLAGGLLVLGHQAEARAELKRFLEHHPEHRAARRLLESLQSAVP